LGIPHRGRPGPLQFHFHSFATSTTVDAPQRVGLKLFRPVLGTALSIPPLRNAIEMIAGKAVKSPDPERSHERKWTILAEARAGNAWRNVALAGADMYGLTAELLAVAATAMADDGYTGRGIMTPVQAVGLEPLRSVLDEAGVTVDVFEAQ
jgi:hypothetical protein